MLLKISYPFTVILKCDLDIIKALLKGGAKADIEDNNGFGFIKHWELAYQRTLPLELEAETTNYTAVGSPASCNLNK